MRLTVTYACGHVREEVRYGGKYEERLAQARRMLCPECYKAQQRAEALCDLEVAALEGSPKQVAWAEDIRAQKLGEVREFFAGHADQPEAVELGKRMIARLAAETSARWWIEHRDYTLRQLFLELKQSF